VLLPDRAARRAGALAELPTVHALALRLRDEGEPPERIATLLGIEREAVGPLLEVAAAKLEEILTRDWLR
jgi:DNA-directed RNA polymerase specialized sigma24 family protein